MRRLPWELPGEADGKLTVLKCKTPGEALRIAGQLEAEDLLAPVADPEAMVKEFKAKGFVSLRVSREAYETAKALRAVLKPPPSADRATEPLSVLGAIGAFLLGLVGCSTGPVLTLVLCVLHHRGFRRKALAAAGWFGAGLALACGSVAVRTFLRTGWFW